MHTDIILAVVADLISAVDAPTPPAKTLAEVIDSIKLWIMGILAAIASLFLAVAALRYTTAGGDPARIEQAKAAFKTALQGYAAAVLSPLVLQILQSILGG